MKKDIVITLKDMKNHIRLNRPKFHIFYPDREEGNEIEKKYDEKWKNVMNQYEEMMEKEKWEKLKEITSILTNCKILPEIFDYPTYDDYVKKYKKQNDES